MAEYSDRKDRTVTTWWQVTADLAKYLLGQDITHLDDWGGKEVVRDILPEVFQKNFDMIQTDLINCILEEKNRETALNFVENISRYVDEMHRGLDAGNKVCYHYFIRAHAGPGHAPGRGDGGGACLPYYRGCFKNRKRDGDL